VDEDNRLLGIITVADIMAAFIELMGVLKSSSRIDIALGQNPEAFEEVSRIISSKGGKIISVGMVPQSKGEENIYFFRLEKRRIGKIVDALGESGYKVIASTE
jgi:acetoin utilization protein AcuB